jgi:hypothetical protein
VTGWDPDPTTAVVAHGLLGSLAVISGAAATLKEQGRRLDEATRDTLLQMIITQTNHVSGVIGDLARGLPPEVLRALSELEQELEAGRSGPGEV